MRLLIDKAELMRHIENEMREWGDEYDALQILGDIEDFPTVEGVVGVISCKDCKHLWMFRKTSKLWCTVNDRVVHYEDYCSWGERKWSKE